ncbi:MAG: proline racemase family protein, partial [Candidatus Limnocylindrales bacterium]
AVALPVAVRVVTPRSTVDEFAPSQPTTADNRNTGLAPRDDAEQRPGPMYQAEHAYAADEAPAAQQTDAAPVPDARYEAEAAWPQPTVQQPELAQEIELVSQVESRYDAPAVQQVKPDWEQPEVHAERVPRPEPTYETAQQIASAPPADVAVELPVHTSERRIATQARDARLTIQTMDLHCAGEPLRIIRSGFPEVPNLPVVERRRWVMQNADHIRRAVIHEPRGHHDMYGAILLPPHTDYADMTVLFMHNEVYSTMCGHGIIAITTGLIEEGLFPATEPVTTIRYEVPAGIVAANAATVQLENGEWAVQGVRFTNVPSYLAAQSLSVRPDGVQLHGSAAQYGALSVDLAFGGAYYGIVNASELGLRVVPEQADALRHAGAAITEVLRRDHTPSHPTDPSLGFVYGTIIVDLDPRSSPDGRATNAHMRNVTIFADAELDRSPCGSGTSAILAQLHARGRIKVGQEIINAGITGEHFLGRVEAETTLGPYPAVSTSIAGTAYVTGFATFIVDNRDPLGEGFLLR